MEIDPLVKYFVQGKSLMLYHPPNDDNWDVIYDDPKEVAPPSTAVHRLKHCRLEDGYIKVCNVVVGAVVFMF